MGCSIPHLTITSPLVNRLCSSRWNYRRCQSPHKGCRLALASKLIIREKTQALTQVGWFRACNKQHPHSDNLCIPRSYLHDKLPSSFPTLDHGWEVPLYTFSYQTSECVTARWCMRNVNCRLWPYWSAFNQSPYPQCRVKTLGIWLAPGFEPKTSPTKA